MHFKIDWASLIVGRNFTVFAMFYSVFEGKFQVQAPGGLYLRYEFGGLIFRGTYTWRGLFSEFYSIFLVAGRFISQASFKRRKAFVLVTW